MSTKKTPRRHREPWYDNKGNLVDDYILDVNPYLFLLLKEMIKYEIKKQTDAKKKKGEELGNREIIRTEVIEYLRQFYEQDTAFLSRIERFVWNKQKFCVRECDLDKLCRVTKTFGEYKNWNEFTATHGETVFAIFSESYRNVHFEELPYDLKLRIEGFVSVMFGMIACIKLGKNENEVEELLETDALNVLSRKIKKLDKEALEHVITLIRILEPIQVKVTRYIGIIKNYEKKEYNYSMLAQQISQSMNVDKTIVGDYMLIIRRTLLKKNPFIQL